MLCRPLCSIFNSSVREGFVPSIWKAANITPVQKSSPPIDVDSDFRPISLTPIISKILESFPYKWLLDSVSKKIDSLQFGSLKGSSTSMALIYMLHKWFEAADKQGNTIRICLLDFSKAFDRLDHNILLEKLKDMEVHPVLLNWIANFLTGRQQILAEQLKLNPFSHLNTFNMIACLMILTFVNSLVFKVYHVFYTT